MSSAILHDNNPWWRGADRIRPLMLERRDLQPRILTRLADRDDRRAVVLLGPRQVGKTTLLRQLVSDLLDYGWPPQNITYFDFSDDRLTSHVTPRQVAEVRPSGLREGHQRILLFDEIGRCSDWSLWLKQAVDTTADRIVVTDSAAAILRDRSAESGAGRWDDYIMEPLSFREFLRLQSIDFQTALQETPNPFYRYLGTGGFPEHMRNDDVREVRRRLRSDIADRAITRDLLRYGVEVTRVRDLFVFLVQGSGGIFDATARGRDLGVDRRSIDRWEELLEDTQLIIRLNRHKHQSAARLRSKPKLYAADHGLILAFEPMPEPLRDSDVRGRIYEAIVYRHLRDLERANGGVLTYLRDKDDLEVDFVLEMPGKNAALIEVTCSEIPDRRKLARLRQAGERMSSDSLHLIHGSIAEEKRDRVHMVPMATFLLDPTAAIS